MIAHAATILLAAFLLFLVQPLIGRYILPLYGGTPAVWTVALLFFQSALLAGYGYAYALVRLFRPRAQAGVHALLALAALLFLPVIPGDFQPGGAPTFEILWLLLRTVGLPFVLLAATSPLLQAWLAGEKFAPRVFRLYALSNVGSLAALLAYPFALEPWVGRDAQAWVWSAGYAAFALATLAVCIRRLAKPAAAPPAEAADDAPGLWRRIVWVSLAACGVWMLMGVTNRMSINIAPTPFLWVLPLALYLLSFVVAFSGDGWYRRKLMIPLMIAALVVFSIAASTAVEYSIVLRIALFAGALLVVCLVLHAELYRLRPGPARLTGYYLSVAGGGALGGAFVGVVAPHVFPMYWEFELGQGLCLLAVLCALAVDRSSRLYRFRPWYAWAAIALGLLCWGDLQTRTLRNQLEYTVDSRRSFFGVSRVTEDAGVRTLVHGTTNHGEQFLDQRAGLVTTYFGPDSGIGKTLAMPDRRRVGVVGLGIGTLAGYGRPGDAYRFYELDPEVEELARGHFSYLADSRAEISVAIGDGRLLLAAEKPQGFDVLVLDAFSSDAVPVHLLTLEAFEIYRRHLAPGAVVAVNVTNHNLDLRPIVVAAARANGWHWKYLRGVDDEATGQLFSEWMLLATDESALAKLPPGDLDPATRELPPWTDDFSNLFRILR